MNFNIHKSFTLFLILLSQLAHAQQNDAKYTYSLGAEAFTGFIVPHHQEMGHLLKGHPSGIRLNCIRESYGNKAWEQRYNYPVLMATLSYYDLKYKEVLGEVISGNIGLGFHLIDFKKGNDDLQFYFGYGLAYFNTVYNPETNNRNNVISSRLPWSVNVRLTYFYKPFDFMKLSAALQLSHFSNASRNVPNFGLNLANINLGVHYIFPERNLTYKTDQKVLKEINKKSYINIDFRMGASQLKPIGTGVSPYYAASIFWNKRVSAKSIIDVGIEGFMNKAIQEQIIHNSLLIEGTPDYKAFGVMFGHELIFEKLAFVTQLGIYLYKPYQPSEWIYSKIGLKFYANDNLYGSFILKTHFAIAEVMEFGVGYRF